MNRKEVINQLKELIEDRKSFMVGDYDEVYDKDVQALEHAIKALERAAPEVPAQEQYVTLKIDGLEIAKVVIDKLKEQQKQSNITLIPV